MEFLRQSSFQVHQINSDVRIPWRFELIIILSACLLFSMQSSRVNGDQFCFTCLAMNCPGDQVECEAVRDFVIGHLRSLYDLETYLPVCKPANDTLGWRLQQFNEQPCDSNAIATCAAGQIRIKSNRGLEKTEFISHATILGCANLDLLASINRSASAVLNRCGEIKKSGYTNQEFELRHDLMLRHCSRPETLCRGTDFCVSANQSVIKEFEDDNRSTVRFNIGLVLGIVAFIMFVFAAIIGVRLCCCSSFSLNRSSNLPRSSPKDTDLVAIRSTKSNDSINETCPEVKIQSLNV